MVAIGAIAIAAVVGTGLLISLAPGRSSPESSPSPSASRSLIASESPSASPTENPSPSIETGPTALPSGWAYADLDGVAAPSDLANRLPIAIMVDDNKVARPQSGFTSASIVYQAPADGGEDRYMLVFQEATASDIGPVRSARPYYVYWAAEYKAASATTAATSRRSRRSSRPWPSTSTTWMRSRRCLPVSPFSTRAAPHNAYPTRPSHQLRAKTNSRPSTRACPSEPSSTTRRPPIGAPRSGRHPVSHRLGRLRVRSADGLVPALGRRQAADRPANNQQVVARNVIVLFQALTYDSASDPGHTRPVIASVGTGKAIVFKEGQAIVATWKKPTTNALTRLYDSSGNEIPLVRARLHPVRSDRDERHIQLIRIR